MQGATTCADMQVWMSGPERKPKGNTVLTQYKRELLV